MAFDLSSIMQHLPSLWAREAGAEEAACSCVLLRLPTDPALLAAGELRKADLSGNLTSLRDEARNVPASSTLQQRSIKWVKYALALGEFAKTAEDYSWETLWSSYGREFPVTKLSDELTLVFMLIAGLWRQSARDRASDILLLEADPQKDLAKKAITVFKHSGAMYSYLVQQHLAEDIAGSVERSPMLHKASARALAALAHAEAQAMVAHLAVLGNKVNILGCLHVGAAELFTSAASELQAASLGDAGNLLTAYAQLSATVQSARARLGSAFVHESQDPAASWAHALEAVKLFDEGKPLADQHDAWAKACSAERLAVEACVAHFRSETEQVALRASPGTANALPAAKIQPLPEFDLKAALRELPSFETT